MKISVIIPVHNEEANISRLYSRIRSSITPLGISSELIFVNDGSSDSSLVHIKSLADSEKDVFFIDLSRNFGHQVAVSAGLDHCKGDSVVIIDADLQDPPELIPDLYKKLCEGYNVVYARRRSRKGEGILKAMTAKLFYRLLSRITSINIPLDTGDFRIIDRKVVDVLREMHEQEKFLRGQIAWIGLKQTSVEYDRDERASGRTGYTYRKMIRFALDGITSFSDLPLKFATAAGFVVSGIALPLMVYTLYSRLVSKDYAPGWASLMLSVLFLGGIQLVCLGVIGEYVSRLGSNVRKRPLYVVGESKLPKDN
jgi:glycosyltransferase involved in cell wall biosynthesis